MVLIDGKAMAEEVLTELAADIADSSVKPGLGIVVVGDDAASALYIRKKLEAAERVGITVRVAQLAASATKKEILDAVTGFNKDSAIHGIIVQLPLPRPEDTDEVIAAIDPRRDADGFSPATLQALRDGDSTITPVMCRVVLAILETYGPDKNDLMATIVAKNPSFVEGLSLLLEENYIDVETASPDEQDLRGYTEDADILIAAGNTEKLITADMVQEGAVVIDIGIVQTTDGKTVGCVDFERVAPKCSAITPVPGGVGPLTVAYLLRNVFEAAALQ